MMHGQRNIKFISLLKVTLIQNKTDNVEPNVQARSCNNSCSGKGISTTNSERVFIALGIQHAIHMPHIVLSGLAGSKLFFHIIS